MRKLIILFLLLSQCTTAEKKTSTTSSAQPAQSRQKFDQTKIRQAVASHKKYLSNCYGQALMEKKSAKLAGAVLIRFTIGPDGRATSPAVVPEKSSIDNKTLNQCLFAGITSWDFPVHPDGLDLDTQYLFQFSDKPPARMQKTLDKFEKFRRQ